jgi:hypothetical protein
MALAKVDSLTRAEVGTATSTPLTRGLVLNGRQVEVVYVTKLTGDTSGSFDLSNVQRPSDVYVIPVRDSAGANVASLAMTAATFTHTDNDTVAVSSLGDWTVAVFLVLGRSYA